MRRSGTFPLLPASLEGGAGGGCSITSDRAEPPPPTPPQGEGSKWAVLAATLLATVATPLAAREVVDASAPTDIAVTIYRNPDREPDEELEADYPEGFALISETRRVTLPAGESTIRFEGVAEGMVGVSAIVTGLPGGTIEKNRNAQLLSPAALVDGTLGNRVTITRTNPATGEARSEPAVVRTRADGGLVLQSSAGFEAVRCSGLSEKLTFDRVPAGLSSAPVYSVDTRSDKGGTYEVTLTYLSWGFDWQANYVGTMKAKSQGEEFDLGLLSWLTLVNDNGQSFDNARLQIIAGKLNIDSDFEDLSDPPTADPLRLRCYPLGSTAAGSPVRNDRPQPLFAPGPVDVNEQENDSIVVTAYRREATLQDVPLAVSVVTAEEENLGDLKLFRVPDRVNVSAKGMKQVAFLNKDEVKARFLYQAGCDPYAWIEDDYDPQAASMLLVTKNETAKGLGIALPQGQMTLYEPTPRGILPGAQTTLRDYARGQDVELSLGESAQVFARCAALSEDGLEDGSRKWTRMRATLTNANPHPVTLRLQLSYGGDFAIRFPREKVVLKNGYQSVEITIPANQTRSFDWRIRDAETDKE